ncbi:hypothetical protein [Trinickia acidisoli]|uniref:hypothetical protein n=1 Tax=Trinickia acidisoli TaxID=2767482 RepID=UPI001A8E9491|nr:hypothetical protein [Trinickia acidisoli]
MTIATEAELIEQALALLKSDGAASAQYIYVIGAIRRFKIGTRYAGVDTRKKMSALIRGAINPHAKVLFFDTATCKQDTHIIVRCSGTQLSAAWVDSSVARVRGAAFPQLEGLVQIPTSSFEQR